MNNQLEELWQELRHARSLDTGILIQAILRWGFRCQRCGDCCRGADAEVLVFPGEIDRIRAFLGGQEEVAEPPDLGEWDSEGNFHTLEWRLCRHEGGCKFFRRSGVIDRLVERNRLMGGSMEAELCGSGEGLDRSEYSGQIVPENCHACTIYPQRPLLCRTYPFYLLEGHLTIYPCRGLGKPMDVEEARALARDLRLRYLREIREAMLLVSGFRQFSPGNPPESPEAGFCIVHDSRGEHLIPWKRIPDIWERCKLGKTF